MKIFEPAAQIIEHALIEYEEHPDKFIPNSNSIIEDTINNIPSELDIIDETFKCLIPNDNAKDMEYDLKTSKCKNTLTLIVYKQNQIY